MTRARTTTEPVRTATTDYGTGFLPRVMRSMLHPLVVHTAIASGWPITNGQVASSLQLGTESLLQDPDPNGVTGEQVKTALAIWQTQLTALSGVAGGLPAEEPASDELRHQVRDIYAHAFALLAVLDEDLLGITSDGGRIP